MFLEIIKLIVYTLIPFLELRFSIPWGILTGLNIWLVLAITIITNILLGVLLYPLIDTIIRIIEKIKFVEKIYTFYIIKTRKKINKYVEKYGEIGVALFISIPLPGSGVYSGALAAYLLGLSYRKFIIACVIGVLIASAAVTLITISGSSAFEIFIKGV
ncbi:MAG: COG2426 family protein [Nanoarchaeota archaeon]